MPSYLTGAPCRCERVVLTKSGWGHDLWCPRARPYVIGVQYAETFDRFPDGGIRGFGVAHGVSFLVVLPYA